MESTNANPTENDQTKHPASEGASPACFRVWLWQRARKIVVFVIGSTVLLIGIVMIVFPGPAVLVIPLGLTILASEFVWARDWLEYAKRHLNYLSSQIQKSPKRETEGPP